MELEAAKMIGAGLAEKKSCGEEEQQARLAKVHGEWEYLNPWPGGTAGAVTLSPAIFHIFEVHVPILYLPQSLQLQSKFLQDTRHL